MAKLRALYEIVVLEHLVSVRVDELLVNARMAVEMPCCCNEVCAPYVKLVTVHTGY